MRITVIGDAMVDRYTLARLSLRENPEGDWPLYEVKSEYETPGGAHNVCVNVESLTGSSCRLLSGIGKVVRHRVVVGGKTMCRIDHNEMLKSVNFMGYDFPKIDCDAIIVSDYCKGSINFNVCNILEGMVHSQGIRLYVDSKDPGPWMELAFAMFPNNDEYAKHERDYEFVPKICVKKMGSMGMHVRVGNHTNVRIPPENVVAVSPVGAGDTVVAAFAVAMEAIMAAKSAVDPADLVHFVGGEHPAVAAARFANAAVSQPGTWAPSLNEVEKLVGRTKVIEAIRKATNQDGNF
jgi:bifunctional ADP-heptose synthase (sugar kinase/adenylyltransferase)